MLAWPLLAYELAAPFAASTAAAAAEHCIGEPPMISPAAVKPPQFEYGPLGPSLTKLGEYKVTVPSLRIGSENVSLKV